VNLVFFAGKGSIFLVPYSSCGSSHNMFSDLFFLPLLSWNAPLEAWQEGAARDGQTERLSQVTPNSFFRPPRNLFPNASQKYSGSWSSCGMPALPFCW
jgi:hypothetical protein